jgi:hypothetical protein
MDRNSGDPNYEYYAQLIPRDRISVFLSPVRKLTFGDCCFISVVQHLTSVRFDSVDGRLLGNVTGLAEFAVRLFRWYKRPSVMAGLYFCSLDICL